MDETGLDDRFLEIDFIRGIVIILMILFHFVYDLNHFNIIRYKLWTGAFAYTSSFIASIFVLLVGVSLTISYNRRRLKDPVSMIRRQFIKRGLIILGLGLVITLFSWIVIPERFVLFGILHCIGSCIVLSIPFLRFTRINLLMGSILVFSGLILRFFTFPVNWFIPFGFLPPKYFTIDYFPLLPWFGVVLIGIALGNILYPNGQRQFRMNYHILRLMPQRICFLGRHSLSIYLIHQPLLLALIFLVFFIFL